METPTINDITPTIKSCVNSYLIAKVFAETMREKVNKVHREILTERPIYADKDDGRQIFESKYLYLCSDENLCEDFFREANIRLRKAGLKPPKMGDEFCPALVAERLLTEAEHALIEATREIFRDVTVYKLLCHGLDSFHKYIDLWCKVVINLPDYKPPKLRRA